MTMRRKYPLPLHTTNRMWDAEKAKKVAKLKESPGGIVRCSLTGAPMWEYVPPEKPPVDWGYAKSDEPRDVRGAKSMAHWGVR